MAEKFVKLFSLGVNLLFDVTRELYNIDDNSWPTFEKLIPWFWIEEFFKFKTELVITVMGRIFHAWHLFGVKVQRDVRFLRAFWSLYLFFVL